MADNPTPTVTATRLDANERDYWHTLTEEQRADICDLIAACGYPAHHTAAVEYDLIDCPLIRLDLYVTFDGQVALECELTGEHGPRPHPLIDCRPGIETVECPAPSLPSWWEPSISGVGA